MAGGGKAMGRRPRVGFSSDELDRMLAVLDAPEEMGFVALVKLARGYRARGRGFVGADLRGIDFGTDNIAGFNFSGADLRGAKLERARGLDKVITDDKTRGWPGREGKGRVIWPPRTALAVWRERVPGLAEEAAPEMVTLPGGDFRMGAPAKEEGSDKNERPRRLVHVPAYALGRCAVTFGQWDAARAAGADLPEADDEGWGRDDRPVINVSWHDARAYCAWLNGRLGLAGAYRLPTEAEWEYACRAGTVTAFSFGATISTDQANYHGDYTYGAGQKGEYRARTVPVGSLPGNDWGLHEMHGNVWEWVEDAYRDSYKNAPLDGSQAVTEDEAAPRVLRGASWFNDPRILRSATRLRFIPVNRCDNVGFRLARTL